MHNLSTVIQFEIARTLKKRSFWIAALAVPVVGMIIVAIILISGDSSRNTSNELAQEKFSIGIIDQSGLITSSIKKQLQATDVSSIDRGIADVKTQNLDALYVVPSDITKESIKIYGTSVGIYKNSRYESVIEQALFASVSPELTPSQQSAITKSFSVDTTTYTSDGNEDPGIAAVIVPGIFLVLFYLLIGFFSNQILMSITEEKENRVIEIILTTIRPTTLLLGKLISLIVLAFIQILVILLPLLIGFLAFRDRLKIPDFDLSTIIFDPYRIAVGAVIFILGFVFFSAFIMTLGAAVPTAKDAGAFFGVIIALVFAPLYAAPLFITSPNNIIVQILSYVPFTAPIPLLLRNAVGNLTGFESILSILILFLSTIIAVRLGVKIFSRGALEYDRKLGFKEIIR